MQAESCSISQDTRLQGQAESCEEEEEEEGLVCGRPRLLTAAVSAKFKVRLSGIGRNNPISFDKSHLRSIFSNEALTGV